MEIDLKKPGGEETMTLEVTPGSDEERQWALLFAEFWTKGGQMEIRTNEGGEGTLLWKPQEGVPEAAG